jgi:hypothetical protein
MRRGVTCSRLRAWNFVHPAAYRVVADKTKTTDMLIIIGAGLLLLLAGTSFLLGFLSD